MGMGNIKIIDGVRHVWSIMDNAWVTLAYWEWVNGRDEAPDGPPVTPGQCARLTRHGGHVWESRRNRHNGPTPRRCEGKD